MQVYVGCCGFCVGRSKYFSTFRTVELQETFYELPPVERLSSLRELGDGGFVFNMKAWQGVTHSLDSPTWRRARWRPPEELRDRVGLLRPTRENLELWDEVVKRARAIGARVVVLQTPPSFGFSEENFRNAREFLRTAATGEFVIGWEPRGDWLERLEYVRRVVEVSDSVIHVVDPFRSKPAVEKEVGYFRLHGIGSGEVNYRYKYTDEDLSKLCEFIRSTSSREVYVMFNNVWMLQDAQRFRDICSDVVV